MSGTLGTKVSKDDVVAVINQPAGAVKISANCIDLEGYVTASEFETVAAYTQVFEGGEISGLTMEAVEGTFSHILADDGRIPMLTVSNAGGFGINVEQMGLTVYDSGYHTFIVTKNGDDYTFYLDNCKIYGNKLTYPQAETGEKALYIGGWESGWGFFSDDDMMDDELDDEKAGFYDIRDICRIDPTVVSLLSLPYGTYMEKNETGEWVEIEDDETELMTMQLDKIEDVLSENLGEGYRIVRDNDELSPIIEWVDWVNQSENDENEEAIRVEVHFEDGTEETFEKGITLRQIWHEDVL